MATPYVKAGPEAIHIVPSLDAGSLANEARQGDASLWHIIDGERALTWCGLFLSHGSERHPFTETPKDRRCEKCINGFGEDVAFS
jgi:hypothetical protein